MYCKPLRSHSSEIIINNNRSQALCSDICIYENTFEALESSLKFHAHVKDAREILQGEMWLLLKMQLYLKIAK